MSDYNGWANYQTWNVALWIREEWGALHYFEEAKNYKEFQDALREDGIIETPDKVAWNDSSINIVELNKLITELRMEEGYCAYREVIFLQGDNADEALKILEEEGDKKAFYYLKQYDAEDYEILKHESSKGSSTFDKYEIIPFGGGENEIFILSWNSAVNYIGLEEVL